MLYVCIMNFFHQTLFSNERNNAIRGIKDFFEKVSKVVFTLAWEATVEIETLSS